MYDEFVKEIEDKYTFSQTADHALKQLHTMHAEAVNKVDPVILELGVQTGISTKVFLNAVHRGNGGSLVSVDIEDCSHVADSDRWTFVQSDSADVENVVTAAPIIKDGIDIVYIDSLHHVDHVRKELFGYFPFVKNGGLIFFDDVDSIPYMRGREKDNIHTEIGNRELLKFLNETFEDNIEKLYLTLERGSSGLLLLKKCAPLGAVLNSEPQLRARNSKKFWKYRKSIEKRLSLFGISFR